MEQTERQTRWRMILGSQSSDSINISLSGDALAIDQCLEALYGDRDSKGQKGSLSSSAPNVARWLGDIRQYFPTSVVRVMQQDAIERLNLRQMLLEPELLETVEADIHLVATLISLKNVIPSRTKDTARSVRNSRPRFKKIDWHRTIRTNLKNYLPEYRTIIPEKLIGFGRKRSSLRDVVLCIDQSGSMAPSVVYSSIFAAVMASIPALSTKIVVFDISRIT